MKYFDKDKADAIVSRISVLLFRYCPEILKIIDDAKQINASGVEKKIIELGYKIRQSSVSRILTNLVSNKFLIAKRKGKYTFYRIDYDELKTFNNKVKNIAKCFM